MRHLVLFLSVLTLSLPYAADAAAPKCFMTSSANPSASKSFTLFSAATDVRDFLQKAVVCPTACYNETVTLNVSVTGIDAKIVAKSQCGKDTPTVEAAQKYGLGCTQGKQKSPTVTIYITGLTEKIIGPKSRCDTTTLTQAITSLSQKDFPGALAQMENVLGPSFEAPTISNPQDPSQYSNVLRAFDSTLTDAQIADAIQNKPDDVKIIAACAANDGETCTPENVTQAARNIGLNLNPDVTGQIAQMKAEFDSKQPSETDNTVDLSAKTTNTGFDQQDPRRKDDTPQTQCGIAGAAGFFAAIESGCGRNTYSATTNVIGPYQFLCGTWANNTARTGNGQYSDCRYAADPDVSTRVMNDVVDQIYKPQYGQRIQELGIKELPGLYMPHLLGENGANKFFSAYQQYGGNMSADQLRGILGNAAIDNNRSLFYEGSTPRTLDGVLAKVNSRMTGQTYTGGLATAGSPFGGFNGYYSGSPVGYGYTSPFSLGYGYGSSYPGPVSTGAPVSTGGQVSTGGTISTQSSGLTDAQQLAQMANGTDGGGGTPARPATPVPPVATLIAQPKSVFKGNPVTVSWSSVGMRTDQPCIVLVQSGATPARLAQGNEGSKTIAATPAGTLTFTLQCSAVLRGQPVTKTVSVIVQ